jgi:hypothetical protein
VLLVSKASQQQQGASSGPAWQPSPVMPPGASNWAATQHKQLQQQSGGRQGGTSGGRPLNQSQLAGIALAMQHRVTLLQVW